MLINRLFPQPVFSPDPPAGEIKEPPAPAPEPAPDPNPPADPKPTGKSAIANPPSDKNDPPADPGPAPEPGDWHASMVGDDAKELERAKRFKNPGDLWKSYRELENKFRSGGAAASVPAPDGEKDPDGLKAWREERGIPESADGYALSDDVKNVLSDEDKPFADQFFEFAHTKNLHPDAVNAAVQFYAQQQADLRANDAKLAEETDDWLHKEFGVEYKPMTALAHRAATEISPGLNWFDARMPDGRQLGSIPEFYKAMVELGTKEFGDASYAGTERATATENRIAELRKIMSEDIDKWDNSPELKKEYYGLIEAQGRRNANKRQ